MCRTRNAAHGCPRGILGTSSLYGPRSCCTYRLPCVNLLLVARILYDLTTHFAYHTTYTQVLMTLRPFPRGPEGRLVLGWALLDLQLSVAPKVGACMYLRLCSVLSMLLSERVRCDLFASRLLTLPIIPVRIQPYDQTTVPVTSEEMMTLGRSVEERLAQFVTPSGAAAPTSTPLAVAVSTPAPASAPPLTHSRVVAV